MRSFKHYLSFAALLLLLSAPLAAQSGLGSQLLFNFLTRVSSSDLIWIANGELVKRGSSTVTLDGAGASLVLQTAGLEPGHVYTVWWMIFNKPQHCSATPCLPDDLFNPAVEASLLYATGEIADSWGQADFSAHLPRGVEPNGQVLFGPALAARFPEIQVVVRTHGSAEAFTPEELEQALMTFEGGCDIVGGPNFCEDQQIAFHLR